MFLKHRNDMIHLEWGLTSFHLLVAPNKVLGSQLNNLHRIPRKSKEFCIHVEEFHSQSN